MHYKKMILACDPSTRYCAFALYDENGRLRNTYKVKSSFNSLTSFFKKFRRKNIIFAVEDQYLNLNVKTLMKLVEIRTTLTTLAKVYNNAECLIIPPQKWQTTMLGYRKAKREQRKALSCMVASEIAKKPIDDDNIADAVCIGEYVKRIKLKESLYASREKAGEN